jgi:hypothetical protein
MNVVSVSWGDHLAFGEADGRLDTPEAVDRRMAVWRAELNASVLHWRVFRRRIPGRFFAVAGRQHPSAVPDIAWDELDVVPGLARRHGMQPLLYVSIFDEGWPLASPEVREVSHHNPMHGKDVAWQSQFSLDHPEFVVRDRAGRPQHGVLSLAFAEVRAHFVDRFTAWMNASAFAGLFVCLRSQSKPAEHGDQFEQRGEFLTMFLKELRERLRPLNRTLSVGAPRGDVLGPPLGNTALEWRRWVQEGLIDALVINQNSSQCPSMWHQLWPMHRGSGYVQNYLTGDGLPPLRDHIADHYAPVMTAAGIPLYIARQWDARDPAVERQLLATPGVSGLVFSSFRHDNPQAVARNDWRV